MLSWALCRGFKPKWGGDFLPVCRHPVQTLSRGIARHPDEAFLKMVHAHLFELDIPWFWILWHVCQGRVRCHRLLGAHLTVAQCVPRSHVASEIRLCGGRPPFQVSSVVCTLHRLARGSFAAAVANVCLALLARCDRDSRTRATCATEVCVCDRDRWSDDIGFVLVQWVAVLGWQVRGWASGYGAGVTLLGGAKPRNTLPVVLFEARLE